MVHFTKSQIETAVLVLKESKMVKEWVNGHLRFLSIDPNSPKGIELIKRESDKYARKLLKQ
jgi:hypothetical protein